MDRQDQQRNAPLDDFDPIEGTEPAKIVCVACGHRLTTRDAAIEVDGRHDHRCVNPSGIVYDIGCFSDAPGAAAIGEPETWFSWFRGAAWQVALCGHCHMHVGWRFTGRKAPFHALILDRLREA